MQAYERLEIELENLLSKRETAVNRLKENERRHLQAQEQFKKESLDVEQLEQQSLSTYIQHLFGSYEKKLDKQLKEEGKTVLLSSHILSEVEKLCDSVSIIRQGSIIETGSMDELRHLTRHNYEVETIDALDGLGKIKGVHQVEREANLTKFQVDSEATNEVLAFLSQYEIHQLTSMPPRLEDLFIRYYEEPGDRNE